MKTLTGRLTGLLLMARLAVACGPAPAQMSEADRAKLEAERRAEEQRQAEEKARLEAEKRLEEELTIKKIIIPKDTKFVPGVNEEAQVRFRDGVIALYKVPAQYDEAIKAFQDAIRLDQAFVEAHYNLGITYERQGKTDKALEIYEAVSKDDPENLDAKGYIAKVYMAKAKKAFELGRDRAWRQDAEKAKKISTEILAKNAEHATANNAMALYYILQGKLETAEEYVTKVLTVEPANVTALTTRGLIFLSKGDLRLARWTFEQKVLTEDPNATEALNNLGIVYMRLDNVPGAVRSFKKAIEVDGDNLEARLNYAAIMLNYLNYDKAQAEYEYVLKAQPDNVGAVVGLGSCRYGKREFDEAIKLYEQAFKLDGRKIELLERVGFLHEAYLNQIPTALDYYRRYIGLAKLPPDSNLALKVKLLDQMWKEQQQQMKQPPPPPDGAAPPAPSGVEGAPDAAPPAPSGVEGAPLGTTPAPDAAPPAPSGVEGAPDGAAPAPAAAADNQSIPADVVKDAPATGSAPAPAGAN